MVLQKKPQTHSIWGFSRCPDQAVTVRETCTSNVASSRMPLARSTSEDGWFIWEVQMPPAAERRKPCLVTVRQGQSNVHFHTFFGDVWLCTGQSNMGLKVRDAAKGSKIPVAGENIRMFKVSKSWTTRGPMDDLIEPSQNDFLNK